MGSEPLEASLTTLTSEPVCVQTALQPPPRLCQVLGQPKFRVQPRVALISAMAEPSLSGGSSSRMMLIPSGITPIPHPCRTRPATTGTRPSDRAQTADPITMSPRLPSSTRRLPYRSPSLPLTGLQTAAASSVEVITLAGLRWSITVMDRTIQSPSIATGPEGAPVPGGSCPRHAPDGAGAMGAGGSRAPSPAPFTRRAPSPAPFTRRAPSPAPFTRRTGSTRAGAGVRPDFGHPCEVMPRCSSALMRNASASWSSRMMMRQAASRGVPWSTSSLALAARRSW